MKLKNDIYRKSRGGHSRLLKITCANCKSFLFYYQKDGPGPLIRAYEDRINKNSFGQKIKCPKCNLLIGTHIIYKKEGRSAFLLIPLTFSKKIVSVKKVI